MHLREFPASSVATTPLSVALEAMLTRDEESVVTLNQLLEETSERGPYGLMILLSLPFMVPVALPGISNVFGAVIIYLAWKLAWGYPPRLPSAFGNRSAKGGWIGRALRAGIRLLRWIEKWVRPRSSKWIVSQAGRICGALCLAAGGFMLALPLPPTIPFSNLIPAAAVLVLAASMMEKDGLMVWAGYLAVIVSAVYLSVMIGLHLEVLFRILHSVESWWTRTVS